MGLAVFISDDDLRRTFDELYDLCPPGSFMVLDFDSDILKQYPQVIETLKATGAPFFMRTPENAPAFMYGAVVERA